MSCGGLYHIAPAETKYTSYGGGLSLLSFLPLILSSAFYPSEGSQSSYQKLMTWG